MKKKLVLQLIQIILGTILFISCKKETFCEGCKDSNKPPIANAGSDQVITLPTDSVSLDGSSSSDPDGKISAWLWTKISGPATFNIVKQSESITLINALVMGTYQFELKVTDDKGLSAKDTVQITVNNLAQPTNRPPVANAGRDQTITLPSNTANLDGNSSTDPDNNITGYLWTKIFGPTSFSILNPNTVQSQLTNLAEGVYQFELKVTDAGGLFARDTMQVIVKNQAPSSPCDPGQRPEINAQLIPVTSKSYGDLVGAIGSKLFFLDVGTILIQGGYIQVYTTVNIYDVSTNSLSAKQLYAPRNEIAVTTLGNKIFFAGGIVFEDVITYSYHSEVEIYDVSTDTWSLEHLSKPKYRLSAAAVGNKVLFAGGGDYSDEVEIFDLSTQTWSMAHISQKRFSMSTVTVNDTVYFAGGWGNGYISDNIDIYDNSTGNWSVSHLAEPKAIFPAIEFDNKIYLAGGINSTSNAAGLPNITPNVEIWDLQTNTSSFACLFTARADFSAVLKNGKIVFFTGSYFAGSNANSNKFDIYDPFTKTWSIGVMNVNIVGKVISANNEIYVASGGIWKLVF